MSTRVKVVGGHLIIEGVAPGRPDNSLPGWDGPVDPGYGIEEGHVDNTLPTPPGIWPPPVSIWPPTPLPPDYPMPPGSVWPPIRPVDPGYGVGNERPDNALPGQPPVVDNTLPGSQPRPDHGLPSQKFLVAIVGVSAGGGLKVIGYTVVDPSLSVGYPLPPPPQAQPK